MSANLNEAVSEKEAVRQEEPTMCKKREILGHAIGALGHDAMGNLQGTWLVPFMTDIKMCIRDRY